MPAEAISNDPVVVVVDLMEFRRALVARFLKDWSLIENVELRAFTPEDAHRALRNDIDCRMIIFNAGSAPCASVSTLAEVTMLRTLAPSAPLIVLAEEEIPDDVIAVVRSGAEGYVSNHSAPDLVLRALSFVLKGGTYVPRTAVAQARFSGEDVFSCDRQMHDVGDRNLDAVEVNMQCVPETAPRPTLPMRTELSERQNDILKGLCRGEPNKIIGRALQLPESTVKVHVREIMRKLGVSNRTQIVVAAYRLGLASRQHPVEDGERQAEVSLTPSRGTCGPPQAKPATPAKTGNRTDAGSPNGLSLGHQGWP